MFVIYLGDNLLKNGIRAIPKMMVDKKADCVISLMPVAEPQRYGIAELSEDGKKVLRCVEKPNKPKSNLAVIGVYAFNHTFFEEFKVVPHNVQGWWKDTGKSECVLGVNNPTLDGGRDLRQ